MHTHSHAPLPRTAHLAYFRDPSPLPIPSHAARVSAARVSSYLPLRRLVLTLLSIFPSFDPPCDATIHTVLDKSTWGRQVLGIVGGASSSASTVRVPLSRPLDGASCSGLCGLVAVTDWRGGGVSVFCAVDGGVLGWSVRVYRP
jgi:hypothetical protein